MRRSTPKNRLSNLVAPYIAARNKNRPLGRLLSSRTEEHLASCVSAFSRFLGRPAKTTDLTPTKINRFLESLMVGGASPYTAKTRRGGLLVLWRYARSRRLTKVDPRQIRTVHTPQLSIEGYDVGAMTKLLAHAATIPHRRRHTQVPHSVWWDSVLRATWETAARCGDMMTLEPQHFDPATPALWVAESKTGKAGWRPLSKATAAAIATCLSYGPANRNRIWPGVQPRQFPRAFTQFARAAGVKGTSRYIRRGSSSAVDANFPGQGWVFLRHSTPKIFPTFYRVAKIADKNPVRPPELPDRPDFNGAA